MAGSQLRVIKALESTESLLASLLDRSSLLPTTLEQDGETDVGSPVIDVEQSLLGVGERIDTLNTSTHRGAPEPLPDPRDTLTSMVCRSVRSSCITLSLEEQLEQKEKELEVTAKLGLALLERKELLEKEVTRLTEQSRAFEHRLSQARHELGRKESLLQLYYNQEDQQDETWAEASPPEWVQALSEECSQLKEENQKLWIEKQELEQEAQSNTQKSQALVKQCFDQLTEAKRELVEVQTLMDQRSTETESLRERLRQAGEENQQLVRAKRQLEDENEEARERLAEAALVTSQLSAELSEWPEKYETCYAMMQDAQEEVKMLKELSIALPEKNGIHTPSSEAEHGSIVEEIEAVLRQEILAASTLEERPPSPSSYAKQRTMVVMETVKAATLATARKLEKLAEDQRKKEGEILHPVPVDPNDPQRGRYLLPQKLQIVKPMEGSATLLQWKLLATPQLGGTLSFFSKSERPGVHQRTLDSPPTTPTPMSTGKLLTVNDSIQGNKRWSSTSDLSRHRINFPKTPPQKKIPPQLPENRGLSTLGTVRQNIWGLFTSPGKNKGNNNNNKSLSGKGLEELLA